MKHTKILTLVALLFGMAEEGQGQVFQVFRKDGETVKFQTAQVDSLLHHDAEGLTTVYLKSGTKETFQKAMTDSVVWYEPTNSILSTLRNKGNYTFFLRLVQESEWWSDMMNGATDLTIFAADDGAWQIFFEENAKLLSPDLWHTATSYEALTADQKRSLLYSAITSTNVSNEDIIRAKTFAAGLEALQHIPAGDVPITYNSSIDKWYWERFHESKGGNGIWLVTDSSFRYTSIFTLEKVKRYGITEQDYATLFPWAANNIANGSDILQQDRATNGVIQHVSFPMKPLQSMAEVIRTNGKTDIFSHILDRFSAPFYSPVLTEKYKTFYPEFSDSIFTKRYFSDNNYSVKEGYINGYTIFEPGPWGTYQSYNPYLNNTNPDRIPRLMFDPGWAGYYDDSDPEKDMAAMFVPSDEAMWNFFISGAGKRLLKIYYASEGTSMAIDWIPPTFGDKEALFRQIDKIPVGIMDRLINNMMQRSFTNSVPSKWKKLTNDAMEPLFDNVDKALAQLDTCLLASNGMVYVMNKLCLTGDYNYVIAPAFVTNISKVIKSAIYDDFMNLSYYTYLKAPLQDITFFMPTDKALCYYYDPISMKSRTPRAIEFYFVGGSFPVKMRFYNYICPYNKKAGDDVGTIGTMIPGTSQYTNSEVTNRLQDILYSHTVVNDGIQDIHSRNEYYRTISGDVVKVVRDANGNIIGAKGTFQLENERLNIESETPGVIECKVEDSYESFSNGQTYTLDAPLVPTYRSLYSIMTNDADMAYSIEGMGGETPYSEFYKLCSVDENVIIGCGLVDGSLGNTQIESALKKFMIFIPDYGLDNSFAPLNGNTPYTAYIPTNEAVREAIAQGLPTWENIREDFYSHSSDGILTTIEDKVRIASKIMTLTNVIKAHFHYGMAIADQEPFQNEYKSLFIDEQLLVSPKLKVNCTGNGEMTVTDWNGKSFNIENKNVFVRDYTCSSRPVNVAMKGITINGYRPGVVHQINGVLGFSK